MTDNTQPEALRALAESVAWTGRWYDAGCNTVHCTYDKEDSIEHDEIAHPVPLGVSGYIAAAHPQAVIALLDRIAELEAQLEAIGAGGVSGPLMGQPQAMPDLTALTERGAKAWAGVDAQGLRDGVASVAASAPAPSGHIKEPYTLTEIKAKIASNDYSAEMLLQHAMLLLDSASLAASVGSEPVYQARYQKGFWQDSSRERCEYLQNPENTCAEDWETRILYTRPPTSAEGVEHG